jgi:hypothetical protein
LKKNPEWVFRTQPLFIYAQKTAILKMHMVRIKDKKTMVEEIMLQNQLVKLSSWRTKIFG